MGMVVGFLRHEGNWSYQDKDTDAFCKATEEATERSRTSEGE